MAGRMPREDESMVGSYAANATPDLPAAQSGRVIALMAEVDRERAQREAPEVRPIDRREEREQSAQARAEFLTHCRKATAGDYTDWLHGYLTSGGKVTDSYDYSFLGSWYVLTNYPGRIPSLYGSLSLNVIVSEDARLGPSDIPNTVHGGCGHSTFYFMDGFRVVGDWVPSYSNVTAN